MQSASGIVAVSLRSFQEIYPLKLDLKSQTASQTGVTGNKRKQNLHFGLAAGLPVLSLPQKSASAHHSGALLPPVVQNWELQETLPQLCSSPYLAKACSGWHCTFGLEQPGGQAGRTDGLAWQECMSAMRGRCTAPTQTCVPKLKLAYLKFTLQTVFSLICSEFLLMKSSKGSACVLDLPEHIRGGF